MPSARRIQDIERLRAIAALAVLSVHVPFLRIDISRFGFALDPWSGVDLFFVISGFVVSEAFERDLVRANEPGAAEPALRAFYRKRAARILPTAYLGLFLWWFGAAWLNAAGGWGAPLDGPHAAGIVVSSLLFFSNYWEFFRHVATPTIWHWSLCIEEHFYLLYPGFRVLISSRRRRAALALSVIAIVQAFRLSLRHPETQTFLSHVRFDQLALGVLIGLARHHWAAAAESLAARLRVPGPARTLGIAAIVLLLLLLGVLPTTWLSDLASPSGRVGYLALGLCAAAIVALASCDADLLAGGRSGLGRVLSALGARSYAVYVFHMPALAIVVELSHRVSGQPEAAWMGVPIVVGYVAVLGGLAEANYRWLERPVMSWASRPRC